EDAGELAGMTHGERCRRFEAHINVREAGDLGGGLIEEGKARMDNLEGEIRKVDRRIVNVAVLEGIHGNGAKRHRLVYSDDLDPTLPTGFEDRVGKLMVGEAKHLDLAVNDVDRIKLQADDAPLRDLPVEVVEGLRTLKGADAAIEVHAVRVPPLQL